MPITNGDLYKVVEVAQLTTYEGLSVKDPATAYYIKDVKKIVVNGIYYGFNSDDVNSDLLVALFDTVDTNSIDLSISNIGGQLKISAVVRVSNAGGASKAWIAAISTDTPIVETVSDASITSTAALITWLGTNRPVANYALGDVIKGSDGTLPVTYYYAKVSASGSTDNLLTVTTAGLLVSKATIQGLIDAAIQAQVLDLLGQPDGIPTLDSGGKVPPSQLPSYVDDVIEAYIRTGQTDFVSTWLSLTSISGAALTPETGKIYSIIGVPAGKEIYQNASFRWGGSAYVNIANPNLKTLNGESLTGTGNISIAQWTVI